jgi:chromosome segregation ATPase
MGGFFRFLVRLVFVLVIGALIGLGLYYGVPWAYRRLVWPVQENSARIAILEDQVAKNSENIFDNNQALQERVVALETEVAELREKAAAQTEDQEALREEGQQLAERVTAVEDEMESQLEARQQAIEALRSDLMGTTSDLEEEVDGIRGEVDGVREELEEARQALSERIETSEENLSELLEGELEEAVTELSGELTARLLLLQTAQDLLKVRLLLVEENPGAARDALALAVAHISQAGELMPSQAEELDDLRERMLDVDDLIAERSFRTRPSLEALWADVMGLVTPLTAQPPITGTQTTSPLPTPTPSP